MQPRRAIFPRRRSGRTRERRFQRIVGYTLLEVMVATGIMVVLGGGLVSLMSQAIRLWNNAERSARIYDQARAVLDIVASDLRSTAVHGTGGSAQSDVRFICDSDLYGNQRLRFVRTISAETADPILRDAGRVLRLGEVETYDGKGDAREAREGRLGAPGGLMEILYALGPSSDSKELWRGFRAPIGGTRSLFQDRVIAGEQRSRGLRAKKRVSKKVLHEQAMEEIAAPISRGVLFLGFSFWGPTTTTWDPTVKPRVRPARGEESGPVFLWDSTRAILDETGAPKDEFAFRKRQESLTDIADDIFPEMVEVTVVVGDDDSDLGVRLDRDLTAGATKLVLSRAINLPEDPRSRFLRIEREWMAIKSVAGRTVVITKDGRGARGTLPKEHSAGSRAFVGVTFRRVVEIPGYRRPDLGEEQQGSRRLRFGRGSTRRSR
ncbi:MAG: hypothetical protein AAF517_27010 [Planctomycetota bacterium]